jgi:hypothetical protein
MLHRPARHVGYPLHSPVAPSFPLPRAAVCNVTLIAHYESRSAHSTNTLYSFIVIAVDLNRNWLCFKLFQNTSSSCVAKQRVPCGFPQNLHL